MRAYASTRMKIYIKYFKIITRHSLNLECLPKARWPTCSAIWRWQHLLLLADGESQMFLCT